MNPEKIAEGFEVTSGMRVADFGCGAGYFTIILAKMVGENGQVTAVDILDSALETIMSKAKAANISNILPIRANLELPNSSSLFANTQDFVLLANVLFQVDKKENVIREAYRVLKPGAKIVIIDWRKSATGMGPPMELRSDSEAMKIMAEHSGFIFIKEIDAGNYHYGQMYKK